MKDLFKIPDDAKTIDNSEFYMKRLLIIFKNGNEISIIKGEFSYGGEKGFYEIMPDDVTGNLKGTELDDFEDDSVKGWLTIDDVNKYIEVLNK